MGDGRRGRFRRPGFAALVLAISAAVAMSPASATTAPLGDGIAAGAAQRVDLAIRVSVSSRSVPYGGKIREVLRVTNRGSVDFPTKVFGRKWTADFGEEINKPGQPNHAGKAVVTYAKSPGGQCSHGTYGATRVQAFACDVTHLAPGESQAAVAKIKHIKGPLLLDAKVLIFDGTIGVSDDHRANNFSPVIVHIRRR